MKLKFGLPVIALAALFYSCDKKEDPEPDENELITTIKLVLTSGTQTKTFLWKDLDGDGGKAPVITGDTLSKKTTYSYALTFLDESKTPAEDVTAEIREKANEHLVVFTPNPSNLLTVTITDKDSKNLPLGLAGTIATIDSTKNGVLKIRLRHQPGSKDGSAVPGSDDANIDFPIFIK